MGELLRSRVLRALGLGRVWAELEALSTRMRRLEKDVLAMQLEGAKPGPGRDTNVHVLRGSSSTIPAPGGVPPAKGDA